MKSYRSVRSMLYICLRLLEQSKACRSEESMILGKVVILLPLSLCDSAYKHVKRDYALPIAQNGSCVVANEVKADSKISNKLAKRSP